MKPKTKKTYIRTRAGKRVLVKEEPIPGMEPLTVKDFEAIREFKPKFPETVRAEWPKMGTSFLPSDNRSAIQRLSDALDEFMRAAIALRAALKRFGV